MIYLLLILHKIKENHEEIMIKYIENIAFIW